MAPVNPIANACALYGDAVTSVEGVLGPLRALPQDAAWNYDEPAVAHAVDLAEGGLSLARGKATDAAGLEGVPPKLHQLIDGYGYSIDYLR
jgi:hypothetical protein